MVLDSSTQYIVVVPLQKGEKEHCIFRTFLGKKIRNLWGMRRRQASLFSNHFLGKCIGEGKEIPFCMRVIAFDRL